MHITSLFPKLALLLTSQSLLSTAFSTELSTRTPKNPPGNYGIIIFPAFTALDVFGPLESLSLLARKRQLNLTIIAATMDPVSTKGRAAHSNPFNSSFSQSVVPTHTFATAPRNLDVLIIPGGIYTVAPDRNNTVDFIREMYPTVKYVVTICTGSHLAAEAGILDGKKATSNKLAWAKVGIVGPKTKWIAKARWVVDGNIWTGSGVAGGTDTMLAFIRKMYGKDVGTQLALEMEYDVHTDASWDPFAEHYGIKDVFPVKAKPTKAAR